MNKTTHRASDPQHQVTPRLQPRPRPDYGLYRGVDTAVVVKDPRCVRHGAVYVVDTNVGARGSGHCTRAVGEHRPPENGTETPPTQQNPAAVW